MEKKSRLEEITAKAKKEDRDLTSQEKDEWESVMSDLKKESVMEQRNAKTPGLGDLGRLYAFGADQLPIEKRTWLTSAASSIVSEHIQDRIFYDLLAQNKLKDAGMQYIRLKPNSRIPAVTAYPDTYWQTEGNAVTPDASLTITGIEFGDHNLTSIVKVSQQLLQESEGRSEEAIRGATANAFSDKVLEMMFSGSGTGQPKGLDLVSGVQTISNSGAVLADYDKIIDAVKLLLDANVEMENISMFAPPVVWAQLAKLKTGITSDLTKLPVPEAIAGIKRYTTSAILEDYGDDDDETKIYLGDFSKAITGISGDFMLKSQHTYANEFNSAFFFLSRLDIKLLKANAFCMIEDIAIA